MFCSEFCCLYSCMTSLDVRAVCCVCLDWAPPEHWLDYIWMLSSIAPINCAVKAHFAGLSELGVCRMLLRAGEMALWIQQAWWAYRKYIPYISFVPLPSHLLHCERVREELWRVTVPKEPLHTQILYPFDSTSRVALSWVLWQTCIWYLGTAQPTGEEQVGFS